MITAYDTNRWNDDELNKDCVPNTTGRLGESPSRLLSGSLHYLHHITSEKSLLCDCAHDKLLSQMIASFLQWRYVNPHRRMDLLLFFDKVLVTTIFPYSKTDPLSSNDLPDIINNSFHHVFWDWLDSIFVLHLLSYIPTSSSVILFPTVYDFVAKEMPLFDYKKRSLWRRWLRVRKKVFW